jgi:type I restriction enzyme S subunit
MSELYKLPNGWEWKTLNEFTTIKSGKRVPKGEKLSEIVTPYPYIRVTDFSDNGTVNVANIKYITEEIYQKIKNYTITDKDIYISVAGTIGKTGIIPTELNGANLTENAVKIVLDNDKYIKKYIFNFTNSITFMEQIGLATKTVAMPKLAIKRLKEVFIPIPALEEQKRIVSKLDNIFTKLDKAINLHQKNIDEANLFMGSILNDVFSQADEKGWEWKKLGDLSEINIGKTPPRKIKEYFTGNNTWLSIRDLKSDYIDSSNEYITNEAVKKCNMKIVKKGTLLMSFKLTLGKTAFTKKDLYTNEAIASLPIKNKDILNKYFLKYCLNFIDLELEVDNAVKGKTLNKQKIKNLNIPLPPLEEQKGIVKYLDQISSKMDNIKQVQLTKMEELKALKASILDSAFRGEL